MVTTLQYTRNNSNALLIFLWRTHSRCAVCFRMQRYKFFATWQKLFCRCGGAGETRNAKLYRYRSIFSGEWICFFVFCNVFSDRMLRCFSGMGTGKLPINALSTPYQRPYNAHPQCPLRRKNYIDIDLFFPARIRRPLFCIAGQYLPQGVRYRKRVTPNTGKPYGPEQLFRTYRPTSA